MTDEADACRILSASIRDAGGWAHKIADPKSDFAVTAMPFDIFGALDGIPLYIEVKYSRGGLKSLDLQRIEDHQISSLLTLHHQIPSACCAIFWAVSVSRGDHRYYVFTDIEDVATRRERRENFKAVELRTLPHVSVRKDRIDVRLSLALTPCAR